MSPLSQDEAVLVAPRYNPGSRYATVRRGMVCPGRARLAPVRFAMAGCGTAGYGAVRLAGGVAT